jgi:DNA-binding PadR family transcriptional regulator
MAINWDAPIEIRDGRNGNWFWIDKEVWADGRLTSSDKVVYGTFAYFANQKNQTAFPSIKTLEKFSGVSKRQIYYSTKKLEEARYVLVERVKGKPNSYTLIDNGINHLETGAKSALVQNNTKVLVQNNTTNNIRSRDISNKLDIERLSNGENKKFGNDNINLALKEFEEMVGFPPTDRKPRYEAYNFVRRMQSLLKEKGREPSEERVAKLIRYYFRWLSGKEWAAQIQTMSTVRRKTEVFKAEMP